MSTLPLSRDPLKRARQQAHAAFDPLWATDRYFKGRKSVRRWRAYEWLARELGMPSDQCHMAKFDRETCARVIALAAARRAARPPP